MIFQHTVDKVLSGEKTQTRRLVKTGEGLQYDDNQHWNAVMAFDSNQIGFHRTKWAIGNIYAVQPGRGKKAVARIRILEICREDVRDISDADAASEGFGSSSDFLATWVSMHDKPFHAIVKKYVEFKDDFDVVRGVRCPYGFRVVVPTVDGERYFYNARDYLKFRRPAHLYDAWKLTFEVVK